MKYKMYLTLFQSNNKTRNKMPRERLAMNIKDKTKCSLRKKPVLSYILNNGFAIFFKSEFLKAEIAEKQQQKYAKKQQKFPSLQPTACIPINKNITFIQFKSHAHYVILPL